jgi:plastocyanin
MRILADTLFHAPRMAAAVIGTALIASCAGGAASAAPESVVAPISPSATTPLPSTSVSATATATAGLLGETTPAASAPPGAIAVQTFNNAYTYKPTEVAAMAGSVAFFVENVWPSGGLNTGTRHNMAIGIVVGEPLVTSSPVAQGKAAIFTVEDLPAGEYVYFCTVVEGADRISHYKAGMVGKLVVTP